MISFYNALGKVSMTGNYFAELVSAAAQSGYGVVGMAAGGTVDNIKNMVQPDFPEKGVRVTEQNGELAIDLHIKVAFGLNIAAAVQSITHRVKYVVEEATGLAVERVDVWVDDVLE